MIYSVPVSEGYEEQMFKQESWLSSLLLPPACQLPTQRADGACCKAIWVPAFSSPHNVPVECEHVTCFDNKMHLISFLSFIIVFSFSFPFFSRAAHFSTAFPSLTQEITQLDSVPSSLLPCGQNLCLERAGSWFSLPGKYKYTLLLLQEPEKGGLSCTAGVELVNIKRKKSSCLQKDVRSMSQSTPAYVWLLLNRGSLVDFTANSQVRTFLFPAPLCYILESDFWTVHLNSPALVEGNSICPRSESWRVRKSLLLLTARSSS